VFTLAEYLATLPSGICSTVLTRTGTVEMEACEDLLQPQLAMIRNTSPIANLLLIAI
jgi:hypothetical protein